MVTRRTYFFYGGFILFCVICSALVLIFINPNSNSYIIPLVVPLLIGIAYIHLGVKEVHNNLLDSSIKVGFFPSLFLFLFLTLLGSLEEKGISLFNENAFVWIGIPVLLGVLILISWIIMIIGLFKK